MNVSDANIQSGLSISCSSARYRYGFYWALAMIIVYPLGIPVRPSTLYIIAYLPFFSIIPIPVLISIVPIPVQLSYLLILYGNRYEISHRFELKDSGYSRPPRALKFFDDFECLAFLYQNYLPKFWYWEIVETYRRLILTAVLTVVSNNEDSKVDRVPSLRN